MSLVLPLFSGTCPATLTAVVITAQPVPRRMLAFEPDGDGWIVRLDCGHTRHIHHRPPLATNPWLLDAREREARVGQNIECARCERLELPAAAVAYKTTAVFDEVSLPQGLRSEHTTRVGVWGRIEVLAGRVRLVTPSLGRDEIIAAGAHGVVAPGIVHWLEPLEPIQLRVVFLRTP